MAKEKGGNNYRPIKNPELLGGQKDNRTISEQAASKKPELKTDKETWVQNVDRNRQAEKFSFAKDLDEKRTKSSGEIAQDIQKNQQKEKDIDHDKDF